MAEVIRLEDPFEKGVIGFFDGLDPASARVVDQIVDMATVCVTISLL